MDKQKLLHKSQHFCMFPWIHVHALPSSSVVPCCVWPYDKPLGNLKTDSLKDIWNNEAYRDLRKKMLSDERVPDCDQCYQREKTGLSLRQRGIMDFGHHFDDIVAPSESDGRLRNHRMAYFDIRFSNICNFKCRGCSPELSSSWLSDHEKLYDYKSDKNKLISIMPHAGAWQELKSLLPTVEQAYFAGGEPLIMDEHYLILEELLALGRTDVALSYNSNMSNLRFRDKSVTEYWNNFRRVSVGVSIDDVGKRGEYFRHGMNWEKTVSNILTVKEKSPHVIFSINCTISLFNVFYIPEIHSELVSRGVIGPGDFFANILLDPHEYRVQELPKAFREKCAKKIMDYLDKSWSLYGEGNPHAFGRLSGALKTILNVLGDDTTKSSIPDFLRLTEKLDRIRGEDFFAVYPELSLLRPEGSA